MKRTFNMAAVEVVEYNGEQTREGYIVRLFFISGRVVNNSYDDFIEAENFYNWCKSQLRNNFENDTDK